MSKADDVFVRQFAVVLGALTVFMFIAIFIARAVGAVSADARHASVQEAMTRIAPVGQVRLPGDAPAPVAVSAVAAPAAVAAAATSKTEVDGAAVYSTACIACHAAGVAGAPKVGDAAAWEPRAGQGLEALVGNAINGLNAMPPRGGNATLSDAQIRAAVEHMLKETGVTAN